MASNHFGTHFRITTWGESHGKAIGVVIDGCPAGLSLEVADIQPAMDKRKGGISSYVTPRKEQDEIEILSGVFDGKTTGAPISLLVWNQDADSSKYEKIKELYRPGHANFTYLEKYGTFDYRGGGRASARETACRVAAGAIAQKILQQHQIEILSYLYSVGGVSILDKEIESNLHNTYASSISCPCKTTEQAMVELLDKALLDGDSLGGEVAFQIKGLPVGLGDPVYEKLEAKLASAMLSIPASKGFEVGEGFDSCKMKGSEHNDEFIHEDEQVCTKTNYAGGTLGGISTGMPVRAKVAFKPTSSIKKSMKTLNLAGQEKEFSLPEGSRHDPCLAIRAVPVVKAMAALVVVDCLLANRLCKLDT